MWGWLRALWRSLADDEPTLTAGVLLAGCPDEWAPAPGLELLWVRLRCYAIDAIWRSRCRTAGGVATTPIATVAAIVRAVRAHARGDWLRVSGMQRAGEGLRVGLGGQRRIDLSLESFLAAWTGLASVSGSRLVLHLSTVHPVAVPAAGADASPAGEEPAGPRVGVG